MRKRRLSGFHLGALGAALALLGCESTCPRETEKVPTPYEDGNTNASGTLYETNAWDEPFVHFPAGRRVALHHGLVETPVQIRSYLAFKECPFPADETEPGFVAESAGNQVLIERVDDEVVRVRNDTCEEFWLRLVASTDENSSETNAGGAGGGSTPSAGAGGAANDLAGAGGR
jgi:hypothetical protein